MALSDTQIKDYFNTHSAAENAAAAKQYGVTAADISRATGSPESAITSWMKETGQAPLPSDPVSATLPPAAAPAPAAGMPFTFKSTLPGNLVEPIRA